MVIKKILFIAIGLAATLSAWPVMAQVNVFSPCTNDQAGVGRTEICREAVNNQTHLFGQGSLWSRVLNIMTFLGGAAAVVIIILAGIRYINSNGNQTEIAAAKTAILYAGIGLIVSVSANAFVNFILTAI